MMSSEFEGFSARDPVSVKSEPAKSHEVHLPTEVLSAVMSFVQHQRNSQSTLHSCCLVSRSWYSVANVQLYRSPVLNGENILLLFRTLGFLFLRTLKSTKSVHNSKSPVSEYVKTLDLRHWPHYVHENIMKELIGRMERGLEAFVAPKSFE
jgi:hypothetical protein